MRKFTSRRLSLYRPYAFLWIGGVILILFIYFWRLGTLTSGQSAAEMQHMSANETITTVVNDPLNAPHHYVQFLVLNYYSDNAFWARSISVIFGLIFIYIFYRLAKLWFGKFIAILSTLLFATTPWVILLSRSATPGVLYLSPIALIASYVWFLNRKDQNRTFAWLAFIFFFSLSLYVPGLIWIVITLVLVDIKRFNQHVRTLNSKQISASILILILTLAPLIFGLVKSPWFVRDLFLIPQYWTGILDYLSALSWSFIALFWKTQGHISIIIDRLPLLNFIQLAFIIFGIYIMWKRAQRELYLLLVPIIFGMLGAGISHNLIVLTLAIPSLGILAAAGMRYLYMEWHEIFPRNPIANLVSVTLLVTVVILSMAIGVRYALIAWPHNAATKQIYVLK